MNEKRKERGTIPKGQYHESAESALRFINSLSLKQKCMLQESYSSCAIENNFFAEVCSETLRRIMSNEPISDRYLLGLAWNIRYDMNIEPEEEK